jgi:hypothetical protein
MTETAETTPNTVTMTFAKGGIKFEASMDFDKLPLESYQDFLIRGWKDYITTTGMSKMVGGSKLEGEALEKYTKEVHAIVAKNTADAYGIEGTDGTRKVSPNYKFLGKSAGSAKVSGAEKQEALTVAKKMVKDSLKRAKKKIGDYKPSVITALAKDLLEQEPSIYATARANIEARNKVAEAIHIDVGSLTTDPERVQKNADNAAKRKAKTKGPLSATQAGRVAARAKPEQRVH